MTSYSLDLASARSVLIAMLLILVAGPSGFAQAPFAEESVVKTRLREAAFRYAFTALDPKKSAKYFCIEPERPQPESFLQRFSDLATPVVWSAECSVNLPEGTRHKKTQQTAMILTISSMRWITGTEAYVTVYHPDGFEANEYHLRCLLKNNQWVVKMMPPLVPR